MKIKRIIVVTLFLCIAGLGVWYQLNSSKNNTTENNTTETESVTKPVVIAETIVQTIIETEKTIVPAEDTAAPEKQDTAVSSDTWMSKTIKTIEAQANTLNPEVLKASLTAYLKAEKLGINEKEVLTIVDYTLPSTARRLWVIDMKNMKVLFNTWVAHGTNSGGAKPTSFSNRPSSLKSSLGVFVTEETYSGGKGYSLRIKGLEHNINDNAYNRSIVFHGAWYVSSSFAHARGMMGRSWGCFAVDNKIVKSLINTIKEKSVVVAYYPDKNWLRNSSFIN